ncbi:phage tail tube protein [Roseibium aggregatum]|uniref:Uncharacterized protein n=1 Tax=Roseibium aggregatum TaxID=187304 RepID=A0A0M6YAD1_9HYPH|nr:phage tail tube protein [Roseibium aggregatum]CTQ45770.1 hypothetical protein LAL4801_04225 [Roseibium aggregatum]
MAVTDYGAGADTSRFQLRIFEETKWGKTPGFGGEPGSAPKFTDLRNTGESLNLSESSTQSEEIRDDRSITDLIRTGFEAGGDVNFEASFGTYDPLLRAAVFGEWTPAVSLTGPVTIGTDGVNGTLSDDDATGVLGGLTAGQLIHISGLTNASEDGFYSVVSVDSADAVSIFPNPTDIVSDPAVTVKTGGMVRNGVTVNSFSIEKQFGDVGQFFLYQGMLVSSMELNFNAEEVLAGTFTFLGKNGANATSTYGDGSPTPASTTPVMNAVNHVASLRESGVELSSSNSFIRTFSISLDNGLRGQKAIGDAGNVGVGLGRVNLTGSLELYFKDGALYTKFINETEISLDLTVTDRLGNSYIFTLPRVKLTNPQISAGGPDEDVIATFEYQALRDPVTGATIQIDRFAA